MLLVEVRNQNLFRNCWIGRMREIALAKTGFFRLRATVHEYTNIQLELSIKSSMNNVDSSHRPVVYYDNLASHLIC